MITFNPVKINSTINFRANNKQKTQPVKPDYDKHSNNIKLAVALATIISAGAYGFYKTNSNVSSNNTQTQPPATSVQTQKQDDKKTVDSSESEPSGNGKILYVSGENTEDIEDTEDTGLKVNKVVRSDEPTVSDDTSEGSKETTVNEDNLIEKTSPEAQTTSSINSVSDDRADININSQIEDFTQGNLQDSGFLASIKSLSLIPNGSLSISNLIGKNEDSASVYLPGFNYISEIPNEKIDKAKNSSKYSSGDDDMILMELAFEDALSKVINGELYAPEEVLDEALRYNSPLKGVGLDTVSYGIFGVLPNYQFNPYKKYNELSENDERTIPNPYIEQRYGNDINYALSFKENNPYNVASTATLEFNNTKHAWSIESVTEDKVVIVNPLNTEEKYIYDRASFINDATDIRYICVL